MPRIALAGFHHETNSFSPTRAALEDYERDDGWPGILRGAEVPARLKGQNIPAAGFLAAAEARGWEILPILWANAEPSGPVTRDAYERIAGEIVDGVAAAGPLDGLYLCLHGAMVPEHYEDGEGELLRRLRAVTGPDLPIAASLDLHANVTEDMVALSDGLLIYRTYPHVDMAETGERAAAFLGRVLAEGKPAKAFHKSAFLVPVSQMCTLKEPAQALYGGLAALDAEAGVFSTSIAMGFPPADLAECGPAVLAYAADQAEADRAGKRLLQAFEARERDFAEKLWPPDEAVAYAKAGGTVGRPVILADTQDNSGAGAPSDGTVVLQALLDAGAKDAVLGLLWDPAAATAAHDAGRGGTLDRAIGANSGVVGNDPVPGPWAVEALAAAPFTGIGPMLRGSEIDLGKTAVLRRDGVRVVVASHRIQPLDRAMFTHIGVDPADCAILVLKSSVHFRADFSALAKEIFVVEAPGPNIDDPAKFPYARLRKGVKLRPMGPVRGA
jgi:microcystin degradation protein MlrC